MFIGDRMREAMGVPPVTRPITALGNAMHVVRAEQDATQDGTTDQPACRSWWLVVGFWWLGDNTLRRRFGSPSRCLETGSQRAVMQSPTTNH